MQNFKLLIDIQDLTKQYYPVSDHIPGNWFVVFSPESDVLGIFVKSVRNKEGGLESIQTAFELEAYDDRVYLSYTAEDQSCRMDHLQELVHTFREIGLNHSVEIK